MLLGPRFRLIALAALGVALFAYAEARAEKKYKEVTFDTSDGVILKGSFYVGEPTKKKEAVVLLLHDFDMKKGGDSHQDGWDDLAEALQAEGYSVLSFDFRGHGNSKDVKTDFWNLVKNPQNMYLKGAKLVGKQPTTLDREDFKNLPDYYPFLVNDIAAAKSFLDRENDRGTVNSSSLIVIGAGQGATLGAMWMTSEWHRQKASLDALGGLARDKKGFYVLDDPEGRDLACAVWLNLSPTLAGREVAQSVHNWLADVSGDNKVPMAFLFGDKDAKAKERAERNLEIIKDRIKKDSDIKEEEFKKRIKFTNLNAIENGGTLAGSQLLDKDLDTTKWIVNKYLPKLMEERGNKEVRTRSAKDAPYLWTFPGTIKPFVAKDKGEDCPEVTKMTLRQLGLIVP